MEALEFLRAIWPEQGIYCLVSQPGWRHLTFDSIAEAAKEAERLRDRKDVYFAVHTLKEHWVPDPSKGEDGRAWRTHANMSECRCFFFDLDVGEGANKYATREDALNGLDRFLFATRLPSPLVVSSGGGLHIYWRLSESIPSEEWYTHAARLRELARRHGLKADPARTTDVSSILRVAGTFNHKEGSRRPVDVLARGNESEGPVFLSRLKELTEDFDVPRPEILSRANAAIYGEPGNLAAPIWNGPVFTLDEVCDVCEHTREYVRASRSKEAIPEPIWYAMLGLTQHLDRGDHWTRELGKPNRTVEEKAAKLAQWNAKTGGQPPSCAKLNDACGGDACARCPFAKLGKNPLTIAAKLRERQPILARDPASEARGLGSDDSVQGGDPSGGCLEPICDPPYPYTRSKSGLTYPIPKKNKEGEEGVELVTICPYDIFPIEVCDKTDREQSFSVWAYQLPHEPQKILKVPSAALQDQRAFHLLLLNDGINIVSKHATLVQDAMIKWNQSVRAVRAANKQFDHLGWEDKNLGSFIMPDYRVMPTGETKPCKISAIAQSSCKFIEQAGTLEKQIELMEFYNSDRYLPQQFMILCGLSTPLFQATGEHGIVVHACGDPGASKSTGLAAGAALWGYPKQYVINGTKTGVTAISLLEITLTLSNLPVCVDEITKMSPEEAQNFAMGVSQIGSRIRTKRNGELQAPRGGYKSTMVLTTGNKSLNNLLSIENTAGTAGHMRVFEMICQKTGPDYNPGVEFLHELNKNYGHIGPAFLKLYMAQRETFDNGARELSSVISKRAEMDASERFWGSCIAAAMVGGSIASGHRLLPFNLNRLHEWLLDVQIPYMRGEVKAEESATSPVSLLATFINDKIRQTVIRHPPGPGQSTGYTQCDLHGPLIAYHDKEYRVMHVRKEEFRRWCDTRKRNGLHMLRALSAQGVVYDVDYKRDLGKGTDHAGVRVTCFSVNLAHPAIASQDTPSKVVPIKKERDAQEKDQC